MEINKDTVRYIGEIARIDFTEEEQGYFAPQLTNIVDYVEKINELDLDGVEPTYNVHGTTNVMDEDVARKYENIDKILDVFPKRNDRFIKIRKVI